MRQLVRKFRQQQAEKDRQTKLEEEQLKQAEEEAAAALAQRLKSTTVIASLNSSNNLYQPQSISNPLPILSTNIATITTAHPTPLLTTYPDPSTPSGKYFTKFVLNNDYITFIKNNQPQNVNLLDTTSNHIHLDSEKIIKLGSSSSGAATPASTLSNPSNHPHMIKLSASSQPQLITTSLVESSNQNTPVKTTTHPTIRLATTTTTTTSDQSAKTSLSQFGNQKLIYLPSTSSSPSTSTTATSTVTPSVQVKTSIPPISEPNLIQKLVLCKKPTMSINSTSSSQSGHQTLASPTTGILKPVCGDELENGTAAAAAMTKTTTSGNIKLSFHNQQFFNMPQTSVSIGKIYTKFLVSKGIFQRYSGSKGLKSLL